MTGPRPQRRGAVLSRRSLFASYTSLVTVAGVLVAGLLLSRELSSGLGPRGWGCLPIAALLVLAELWPVPVPRSEQASDEITLSSTFGLALLFIAPLSVVMVVQAFALVVDTVLRRRVWSRLPFNIGQYALSYAAAGAVYRAALDGPPWTGSHVHLSVGAALAAGFVFFVCNNGLVAGVLALQTDRSVLEQFVGDLRWQALTAVPATALAPAITASLLGSPFLLLCLLAPLVTVVHSGRLASRREYEALHDGLTGLGNRAMIVGVLDRELANPRAVRHAVLLVDLDHFKDVNDTLGHQTGDALLQAAAGALLEAVPEDGLVARLGGDEFAVLLRGADQRAAVAVASQMVSNLRQPCVIEGISLRVRGSVGISCFPNDGLTTTDLLRRADVALYKAKETRDGLVCYQPQHDSKALDHLTLVNDLLATLEDTELSDAQLLLAFQPLVRAADDGLSGVECLVRWHHPRLGVLLPGAFLSIAEHANLTGVLGNLILDKAIRQQRDWAAQDMDVCVSVNVFVNQLSDVDFPEQVGGALGRYGVRPDRLVLEVTEDGLMSDPERSQDILRRVRATGVRVSIDDYGAGYSSLAYVKNLEVDELKIDRQFVAGVRDDPTDRIIVKSTIDLAHQLGLRVVAEGVEDQPTRLLLQQMSCDVLQGMHTGAPGSQEAIAAYFQESRQGLRVVSAGVG